MYSDATTQDHTQPDQFSDLSQKLSQVVTPPQKLPSRKRARLSTGMSLSASLTIAKTCEKCGVSFKSGMLFRMHKYKRCDSKTETSVEAAQCITDFTKLSNFGEEQCQLVCYVLCVQPIIQTGDRRYLLRAVLVDKNGRRCNLI